MNSKTANVGLNSLEEVVQVAFKRADALLPTEKKASLDAIAFQEAVRITYGKTASEDTEYEGEDDDEEDSKKSKKKEKSDDDDDEDKEDRDTEGQIERMRNRKHMKKASIFSTEVQNKQASTVAKVGLGILGAGALYGGWAGHQWANEVQDPEDRSPIAHSIVGAIGNIPAGMLYRHDTKDFRDWKNHVKNKMTHKRDYRVGEFDGATNKKYREEVDHSPEYQKAYREGAVSRLADIAEDDRRVRSAYGTDLDPEANWDVYADFQDVMNHPKLSQTLDSLAKSKHKKKFIDVHARHANELMAHVMDHPNTQEHLREVYKNTARNRSVNRGMERIGNQLEYANRSRDIDYILDQGQYSR